MKQRTSKDLWVPLLFVIYWSCSLLLHYCYYCPGKTHLEKTKFSFASVHQLHTAFEGTDRICISTSHSSSKTPSGGNFFSLCEFIFCIDPIDLENLNFTVLPFPLLLHSFCCLFFRVSWALTGWIWWRHPFLSKCSNIPHSLHNVWL